MEERDGRRETGGERREERREKRGEEERVAYVHSTHLLWT